MKLKKLFDDLKNVAIVKANIELDRPCILT